MTATIPANKPVFLLGFMGSGKTYWGGQWARQTSLPFIDLDRVIEQKLQASISNIFETKGEDFFREAEAAALREISTEPAVVACGGGTPCFFDNMGWMNERGTTIYLKATPAYLFQNISAEPFVRPLLKNMNSNEILFYIQHKVEERENFYMQAKLVVDVEQINVHTLQQLFQKK